VPLRHSHLFIAVLLSLRYAGLVSVLVMLTCYASRAQAPVSLPEEIEWTWEVRPPHPDAKLPNVLLLGDSITRNYFPQVTKDLAGLANVYLMSSSTSIGDPRLPLQIAEFAHLENVSFDVVHCNNGMHGWDYTEAQYKAEFSSFLMAIAALPGHPKAIWGSTTPVKTDAVDGTANGAKKGATNARVEARNTIAKAFVDTAKIPIDDLHELMTHHADLYQDTVHFNTAGANLMGDQVATIIKTSLTK
jgi:hypothetical protein